MSQKDLVFDLNTVKHSPARNISITEKI